MERRGTPARLWQGASQVEAPVIQFDQKEKRLVARELDRAGDGCAYRTGECRTGKAWCWKVRGKDRGCASNQPGADVFRRDAPGGVYAAGCGSRARTGDAWPKGCGLSAGGAKAGEECEIPGRPGGRQGGFMGGGVERVVATGHIEIDQPGRRATGERVVYTASDGMFVMTGTAAAPPQVVDDTRER